MFGTISNITDLLLIFIPQDITHRNGGEGQMYWYWSLLAFVLADALIGKTGGDSMDEVKRNFDGFVRTQHAY